MTRVGELAVRPMRAEDLGPVGEWLAQPHVSRWYVAGSTLDDELDDLRQSVTGEQPVEVLIVLEGERPVGWCQWYSCADDPDWAADVGGRPHDVGIDYCIGEPDAVGRGLGTALVALLVAHVRDRHPSAALLADPEAANMASRRVLEKNGFELVAERILPSESAHDVLAVYRLDP